MNMSIINAQEIQKNFDHPEKPLCVLKGITHSFKQGHTYAITGVSGSGKSTLLHILGGLDKPTIGKVLLNNEDLATLPQQKNETLLNKSLGFVFQFHYLINELTVLENIILMGMIQGKRKSKCSNKAHDLLDLVGLADKAHSYPFHLSGGEQQRISILRAIFNKPHFLLADEPTGNLDAKNAQLIVDFFLRCQKEWNMGLIICSHDKAVYNQMEQVLELKNGILTQHDNHEQTLNS